MLDTKTIFRDILILRLSWKSIFRGILILQIYTKLNRETEKLSCAEIPFFKVHKALKVIANYVTPISKNH